MYKHSGWLLGVLLAAVLCVPSIAAGQWADGGVAVISETFPQTNEVAVSDGQGGAYVIWSDERQYPWRMLTAQRLDEGGEPRWISDGIQVCAIDTLQADPVALLADNGSVYVAWRSWDGPVAKVSVQRIEADGTLAWGLDGVQLVEVTGQVDDVRICRGYWGSAVVAWRDDRTGEFQVYAQCLGTDGNTWWTDGGNQISLTPNDKWEVCLAADSFGGAFLAWVDIVDEDVYAEWIRPDGSTTWSGGTGVPVCTAINAQNQISLINDGAGGAIVSWSDYRTDSFGDIYAQKLEPVHGSPVWSTGVVVCNDPNIQGVSQLVADGNGGAYVVWLDARDQAYDLYAQKLGGTGAPQWAMNGVAICNEPGLKYFPVAVPDGTGGMIAAWQDRRSGSSADVYATRIDAALNYLWGFEGLPVCAEPFDQIVSSIVPDGQGGATFVWSDDRLLFDTDVYAQRIDRFGKWGFPVPHIVSVRDIPGDQGGQVRIAWYASRLDINPLAEIFYYSIWRAIDVTAAAALIDGGAVVCESGAPPKADSPEPILRRADLNGEPYFWTKVGDVESSHYIDTYAATVPTLFDSTATSFEPHYFQVIAHGHNGLDHWISETDSCYSVDNLAPAAPQELAGEQVFDPIGLSLSWRSNGETDLAGYAVYRGTSTDFIPDTANLVASTADTLILDTGWTNGSSYWYKVSALDVHGNESPHAVLAPGTVSAIEATALPSATYIDRNFPNPFNPSTTISFGLHEPAHVSLRIHDAAGRLVRTLVDEPMSSGRHAVVWSGRNTADRDVASGVYFCRLNAGEFERTRKMILVR